jgi:hypothetical protein
MMHKAALLLCRACACLLSVLGTGSAGAVQLISEPEAKLPDDDTRSRGISRGPKILLISPAPKAGFIRSPFNLKLRFQSFGGAAIDLDSIVITYKKIPPIDLTQRVRTFLQSNGIDLDDAEAPPGEHRFRVDVKDSDGRAGTTEFTIKVSN